MRSFDSELKSSLYETKGTMSVAEREDKQFTVRIGYASVSATYVADRQSLKMLRDNLDSLLADTAPNKLPKLDDIPATKADIESLQRQLANVAMKLGMNIIDITVALETNSDRVRHFVSGARHPMKPPQRR